MRSTSCKQIGGLGAVVIALCFFLGATTSLAAGTYDGSYQGTINYTASNSYGSQSGSLGFTFKVTDGRFVSDIATPVFGNVHLDGAVNGSGLVTAAGTYGCSASIQLSLSGSAVTGSGSFSGCQADGGAAYGSIVNVRRTSAPAPSPVPAPKPSPKAKPKAKPLPQPNVNTQLPPTGTGYYTYCKPSEQDANGVCKNIWGTKKFVQYLESVAERWYGVHPDRPIGIGDLSRKGGGPLPPHKKGHRIGQNADIRAISTTATPQVSITDPNYDGYATAELVRTILETSPPPGTQIQILFNDRDLMPQVCPTAAPGQHDEHDNHLHVQFVPIGTKCKQKS